MTTASTIRRTDDFRLRAVQDALADALAQTWLRRAAALEAARPRPGDYLGHATAEDVRARDERLARTADLCRHRAALAAEFADREFPLGMLRAVAATGHTRARARAA